MASDPRIQELLEELLESGGTPEEVCRHCPDLLPEVIERWQRLHECDAQLDAWFPESGSSDGSGPSGLETTVLPRIRGYEVQGVLGRGGMGVVYKAWHLRLNRPVALKMLLAGAYARPAELERFLREAEAVAGLRHANIVQVHDVGDVDGRPYFTMEFVEGGNLAQKLAGTPQPAVQAAALVATVAEAIQVAHQSGIVHRDLTPANILLTAGGAPKISDFGLARRLEDAGGLTQSGAAMGTPSYMAPEQAQGRRAAIGPATDVYALGAVLYELLTGRPPFRAETAAETVSQLINQDPAAPSQLNAKVPRDLETVCLKCLNKEPERRYASAAELAGDLRRFGEGRPILARRLGRSARLWRWSRRKPAEAALLAVVGLALCGAFWLVRQRAERRAEMAIQEERAWRAVEARLDHAAMLQAQGRWPEVRAALEGTPSLLSSTAPAQLRERLRRAHDDADMIAQLEDIRLRLSEGANGPGTGPLSPEGMYAEAFQKYGITLSPAGAARLRNSAIHETLLAFLHDWLFWVSDANRDKLRAIVDLSDDDEWRRAFRDALAARDSTKLKTLAITPEAADQAPVILAALGGALIGGHYTEETLALLNEAQQRHPEDFWINYLLGQYWIKAEPARPQLAAGYFRAAIAVRPSSDQGYRMLGNALGATGDVDAAIVAYRRAIALNPNSPTVQEFARVITPRDGLTEARDAWEKRLEYDPRNPSDWYGYAQLCLFLGNEDAYRRARKALLDRFGDTSDDWILAERTSLCCLLLPVSGDELRRAALLADRAVAAGDKSSEPGNPYLRFVKGLAEYRAGRPLQAIPLLQEAAERLPQRAGPRLALAMAQFQSGSRKESRKSMGQAVRAFNWNPFRMSFQQDQVAVWISHILRREAESMILPNLPAFLEGKHQPQDNDERLALLGICVFQGRYVTAARLYADAFAADPQLALLLHADCVYRATRGPEPPFDRVEVFNSACRYLAARCAVLAGCGLGSDGRALAETERTYWRQEGREWLRTDLPVWTTMLQSNRRAEGDLARSMLIHWGKEPDLIGIRERTAIDKLPPLERAECLALWSDVEETLKRARQIRAQ